MTDKRITDFPQIYSNAPCLNCITLPICLNKDVVSILKCKLVGQFFYSEAENIEIGNSTVINLDHFPSFRYLVSRSSDGPRMIVNVIAINIKTSKGVRLELKYNLEINPW